MTIKCPNCGQSNEIGEASRENQFCGNCFATLTDRTAEMEHNQAEIKKLRWWETNAEPVRTT